MPGKDLGPGVLVGAGIMILAATAPTQIALASKVDPPEWMALVSTTATAIASLGALAAAYFSSQQAKQSALSRKAGFLVPTTSKLIQLLSRLKETASWCQATASFLEEFDEAELARLRSAGEYMDEVERHTELAFNLQDDFFRDMEDFVVHQPIPTELVRSFLKLRLATISSTGPAFVETDGGYRTGDCIEQAIAIAARSDEIAEYSSELRRWLLETQASLIADDSPQSTMRH